MNIKVAAEELLKIAENIEKDAADVTQFVCDKCNHTATLAMINAKRKEAAEGLENIKVSEVTVNDKIQCPACDGVMAYRETEASAPYYYDPETKKESAEENKDYDAL